LLHEPREVVRATRSRQRPDVLEPEVGDDLVDAPGPGGVGGVRERQTLAISPFEPVPG
jgi:hypothetical protein